MEIPQLYNHLRFLTPTMQNKMKNLRIAARKAGFTVRIEETARSEKRQAWLFGKGRTYAECIRAGMKDTWAELYANPEAPIEVQLFLSDPFVLGKAVKVKAYTEDIATFLVEEAAIRNMKIRFIREPRANKFYTFAILEDANG